MADTESSVNERLPFSPLELEAHWDVNCATTLTAIQRLSNQPTEAFGPEYEKFGSAINEYLGALKKCAIIYNTKGVSRYSPCIDYFSLYSQLNDLKSALFLTKQPFNQNQIQSILGALKNGLDGIHCTSHQQ